MEHKFKIGDRARLIRSDVPFNAGETVEVVGFSPDGEPTVRIGERAHWVYSSSLEPIESAPSCAPFSTPAIKAGDKQPVPDVPLLESTRLLTTIKLD